MRTPLITATLAMALFSAWLAAFYRPASVEEKLAASIACHIIGLGPPEDCAVFHLTGMVPRR